VPVLDAVLPLMPGRMIVVAARPGGGKTTLALQAARRSASRGAEAAVVSLEMTPADIAARLISGETGATTQHVFEGALSPEQIQQAKDTICERVSFHAASVRRVEAILAAVETFAERRCVLIVVDYLQLAGGRPNEREHEYIARLTHGLSQIATQYGVCVMALSQFNREGKGDVRDKRGQISGAREPSMTDLKGCGSIEDDAAGIVFLVPMEPEGDKGYQVDAKIAKNRFGKVGRVKMRFYPARCRFVGNETAPAQEPAASKDAVERILARARTPVVDDEEDLFG